MARNAAQDVDHRDGQGSVRRGGACGEHAREARQQGEWRPGAVRQLTQRLDEVVTHQLRRIRRRVVGALGRASHREARMQRMSQRG